MASVFGHAVLAGSLGTALPQKVNLTKIIFLGILCSILPDVDVLAFKFGIPYEHLFGHRGFTHSIFFAVIWSIIMVFLFHGKSDKTIQWKLGFYYFICTVSHPILDAMTTGGMGVALGAPFNNERIFLPWRVIKVSPLGAGRFFSKWGLEVLKSEFVWIFIPSLVIAGIITLFKRIKFN